jgi:phosphatidylglycerophosphatase A
MATRTPTARFGLALASAGYVGYIPFAPGTFGSAAAVPVWYLLRQTGVPVVELLGIAALFAAGVWSARVAERELALEDPGLVVIDEVVGMLVTVLWLPLTWQVALAGFIAFRIFDIAKPFPVGRFERLPGGWGVMADDVMAGVYAYLTVRLVLWVRPEWLT